MPKNNLFQDMVMTKRMEKEKKRLSDSPSEQRIMPEVPIKKTEKPQKAEMPEVKEVRRQNTGNGHKYKLWAVAGVALIFFLFALSYLFAKAVITVNPKVKDVALSENLSASVDGTGDVLPFDLIAISDQESKSIPTTEEKDVAVKAKGTVMIYNTYSSAAQKLDIDTRLEGSNGKIYKTEKAITVPGMKGTTPGSVEVGIYAAEAGEAYNSGPLDFKIFGFKGTAKYTKFYAESNGAITGGLQGKFPVVSDEQKATVTDELTTALKAKLFKKATDQIPAGFILFKDAVFLNIDDNNIDTTPAKDNILPATIKGTLYGLLFNEDKLTKKIAKDTVDDNDGSTVFLPNIRDLDFSLTYKDSTSFASVKNINFTLSGATKIVWKLDADKLTADLLGKPKKDFNPILLQYPNVDSADLVVRPIWKMSLPDKTKDIQVIINYPQ